MNTRECVRNFDVLALFNQLVQFMDLLRALMSLKPSKKLSAQRSKPQPIKDSTLAQDVFDNCK